MLAILPEMIVKGDHVLDVQPFHDRKTHCIAVAEGLVLIALNDDPGPPFVSLFSADDIGLSGDGRLQKGPGLIPPHADQDQSVGFSENKIGGEQVPLLPLRLAQQARRITMMGISAVESGIKAPGVYKDPVHGQ